MPRNQSFILKKLMSANRKKTIFVLSKYESNTLMLKFPGEEEYLDITQLKGNPVNLLFLPFLIYKFIFISFFYYLFILLSS